jgi:uncharacterized protein (DUF1330 family)
LARGGRYEVLEGETQYERFVVAEYESFDVAKAYFNSPEYQAAAEFRRHGAGINDRVEGQGVARGRQAPPEATSLPAGT